jgi:hypothetical protein
MTVIELTPVELQAMLDKAGFSGARRYAETHPRPHQVTIGQAAEILGIGRNKATRLVQAGTLKLNRCNMIPIEVVDAALQAV